MATTATTATTTATKTKTMAMDSTTGGVGGGGGGGRNRGRRGMWSVASTELEIALEIATCGRSIPRADGSSTP